MNKLVMVLVLLACVSSSAAIRRSQNLPSSEKLRADAFDPQLPFQVRWRALVGLAVQLKSKSVPDLEAALNHSDWFMRDAGLKALETINREKAIGWGRRLIHDRALVVRTTAVQVLHRTGDTKSADLLWRKLFSKENFRGHQSLWIRHHIASALVDLSNDKNRFKELLTDSDPKVRKIAERYLKR